MLRDEETNSVGNKYETDMMSLTIRDGQLQARFRSSPTEGVSITSSDTYNDDQFHNVVVVRSGRKVEVLVDDVSIGMVRLGRQAIANLASIGGYHLMLGGLRPDIVSSAIEFVGTDQSLTGCIADVSFNNQYTGL